MSGIFVGLVTDGIAYDFHDHKISGIDRADTTFRKLPDADREGLTEAKALALMRDQPLIIKRPVVDLGSRRLAGFKREIYTGALKKSS